MIVVCIYKDATMLTTYLHAVFDQVKRLYKQCAAHPVDMCMVSEWCYMCYAEIQPNLAKVHVHVHVA